jgi:hypothetical protein
MKELFSDILSMEGIKGVLLLSLQGEIIFKEFPSPLPAEPETRYWRRLVNSLEGIRETDLVYEKGRLYIRITELGYLLIFMGYFVSSAMLRLNCDILLPALKPVKTTRGLKRFFKK